MDDPRWTANIVENQHRTRKIDLLQPTGLSRQYSYTRAFVSGLFISISPIFFSPVLALRKPNDFPILRTFLLRTPKKCASATIDALQMMGESAVTHANKSNLIQALPCHFLAVFIQAPIIATVDANINSGRIEFSAFSKIDTTCCSLRVASPNPFLPDPLAMLFCAIYLSRLSRIDDGLSISVVFTIHVDFMAFAHCAVHHR